MVRAKSTGPTGPKDVPSPVEAAHKPVGDAGTPAGAAQPLQGAPEPPAPALPAGGMGELTAPTNRPEEPITAGLGPAAAARAASQARGPRAGVDLDAAVRAFYSIYPHPHLLELMS